MERKLLLLIVQEYQRRVRLALKIYGYQAKYMIEGVSFDHKENVVFSKKTQYS